MEKIAVVLFNLGGPDSKDAIEPFLFNFFTDKNIIGLPYPFRWLLAKLISKRRSKREAGESYGELGDKSPLLENSEQQALALENALNNDAEVEFKTFISMRYWHPMSDQVVEEVKKWGADKIVILPLYPQFSTTTTWSSIEAWDEAISKHGLKDLPRSGICCYPFNDGFVQASADNVGAMIDQARKDGHESPRVLFSAHGLPEKTIKDGDPYQWQCEQTAEKIVSTLDIENLDWTICYQSKVGPLKWIGPSLDEELERAAADKKAVVIYPHAFTQEHVETLVELDIEYKHEADELGIDGYYRAGTVGTHPAFIDGLVELVHQHMNKDNVQAEGGVSLCPENFNRCCMRSYRG